MMNLEMKGSFEDTLDEEGWPQLVPNWMKTVQIAPSTEVAVTYNRNFSAKEQRNKFEKSRLQGRGENLHKHLEVALRFMVYLGPDFYKNGSQIFNHPGFEMKRISLMKMFKIKTIPDTACQHMTIQRLAYCFPEIVSYHISCFAFDHPHHEIFEGLDKYGFPGALCWEGASALIPKEYTNLMVMHQIWCMKHELRLHNSSKSLPLSGRVFQLWLKGFVSTMWSDKQRKAFLKNAYKQSITRDMDFKILQNAFGFTNSSIRMVPYENGDNIEQTLTRINAVTKVDDFVNFYSMINRFLEKEASTDCENSNTNITDQRCLAF